MLQSVANYEYVRGVLLPGALNRVTIFTLQQSNILPYRSLNVKLYSAHIPTLTQTEHRNKRHGSTGHLYGRSRCCAPSQSAKRADELNFDMDPKRISTSSMLQDPTPLMQKGILIDYTIGKDLETYSLKKLFEN